MKKNGLAVVDVALGFISAYQIGGVGTVGALLVLNGRARPLEFHCTAPIQPSRTQQILYGATLQPYLYGEEIAVALLRRARAPLALAITNEEPMLAARSIWDRPLCLLAANAARTASGAEETTASRTVPGVDRAQTGGEALHPFTIGPFGCYCCVSHLDDAALAGSIWEQSVWFDLAEPFDRLREAVEEAHRGQAA